MALLHHSWTCWNSLDRHNSNDRCYFTVTHINDMEKWTAYLLSSINVCFMVYDVAVGKFLGHFGHDYLYSYSIAFLIPVLYPIVVIEIFIKNIIKERKVSIHMIVNAITVKILWAV